MLAQASHKKSKSKVKKVLTGCHAEDYRVKRLDEPTVELKSLNNAQPMAEVLKRDEEITSMYSTVHAHILLK